MSKQILTLTRGIPASGKSTWSRQQAELDPNNTVVVSKDGIRQMLGTYWVDEREPLVKVMSKELVKTALTAGYSVIVDDTNLHPSHEPSWREIAEEFDVEVVVKDFHIDLWEAIKRDRERGSKVGPEVLTNFFIERYTNKENPLYSPLYCPEDGAVIEYDKTLGVFKCTECEWSGTNFKFEKDV
jgi:predicted kinase